MGKLETGPRIEDPDAYYRSLLDAHEGLDVEASLKLNAKLVIILSNHIGNPDILAQALTLAKKDAG